MFATNALPATKNKTNKAKDVRPHHFWVHHRCIMDGWMDGWYLRENDCERFTSANNMSLAAACLTVWLFNPPIWRKAFPHIGHMNGFSPVWIRSWLFRWCVCLKPMWQKRHLSGLSPVWMRMWIAREAGSRPQNLHSGQLCLKQMSQTFLRLSLAQLFALTKVFIKSFERAENVQRMIFLSGVWPVSTDSI